MAKSNLFDATLQGTCELPLEHHLLRRANRTGGVPSAAPGHGNEEQCMYVNINHSLLRKASFWLARD